jgi:hypothetical protein
VTESTAPSVRTRYSVVVPPSSLPTAITGSSTGLSDAGMNFTPSGPRSPTSLTSASPCSTSAIGSTSKLRLLLY